MTGALKPFFRLTVAVTYEGRVATDLPTKSHHFEIIGLLSAEQRITLFRYFY